ncbi:hypothetical protein PVAP13_4KG019916 [Panicum virgatum]|uniref:F-box domain-containing protein n=1 Tax=Panicum virgatum TaxID=38727 RepID=A0A8T0THW4_PANVG|nr:hypothetical protein PVAP13_4KG019916 [Panicum virgatum]
MAAIRSIHRARADDDAMDAGEPEDRLTDLPDCVLGHVLSFLDAKQAGRAAVLSRRYRHAFAGVHTVPSPSCRRPRPPAARRPYRRR